MTKVFNYWAMRDKVDKIGIVTDRIILAKRTRCSLLSLSCPVAASLHYFPVETAYLLGVHSWEREMLEEAGGEFIALHVRATRFFF
jgi:hypothetical protein